MSAPLKDPVAPPSTWGEVHAHQRVMRYRHSGAGPAVVLLGAEDAGHAGDLWPELPGLLQAHFRVVIPLLPDAIGDVARSLECLLDGVGATGIGVVAGGPYLAPAMEVALGGSDHVSRLVLVGDGNSEQAPRTDSAMTTALHVPLLILSRRLPVSRALALAVPFLGGIVRR